MGVLVVYKLDQKWHSSLLYYLIGKVFSVFTNLRKGRGCNLFEVIFRLLNAENKQRYSTSIVNMAC